MVLGKNPLQIMLFPKGIYKKCRTFAASNKAASNKKNYYKPFKQ